MKPFALSSLGRLTRLCTILMLGSLLCQTGCVHPLAGGFYQRDLRLAAVAEERGNYLAARVYYIRARGEADNNFLGAEAQSCAVYNIARMNGMLGYHDVAERQFKEALALEAPAFGPDGGHASMRWFELAHLYDAWGRYPESVAAYEKGFALVENKPVAKEFPGMYATCLKDFARVLEQTGQPTRAQAMRAQAAALGDRPSEVPIRYYPKPKTP